MDAKTVSAGQECLDSIKSICLGQNSISVVFADKADRHFVLTHANISFLCDPKKGWSESVHFCSLSPTLILGKAASFLLQLPKEFIGHVEDIVFVRVSIADNGVSYRQTFHNQGRRLVLVK